MFAVKIGYSGEKVNDLPSGTLYIKKTRKELTMKNKDAPRQ